MPITYKDDIVELHTYQVNLKDGTRQFRRLKSMDEVYEYFKACDVSSIEDLGSNKVHYRSM
jgi:hypothetical protein